MMSRELKKHIEMTSMMMFIWISLLMRRSREAMECSRSAMDCMSLAAAAVVPAARSTSEDEGDPFLSPVDGPASSSSPSSEPATG